jgi:hypothetical protein
MELGAPGSRNAQDSFSTDLAADMAISPADVKAAVRASQVMKAADVPPELAAELDEPRRPAAQPAKQPEAKQPAKQPEAKQPEAKQPEAKQPAKQPEAKRPETAKPIQMPTERPVLPSAPPAQGVSPVLLVLLALVILGAGGFLLWKFVFNKKPETAQVTPTPTPTPTPMPPAPPPVETAKLAVEQAPPEEIKPTAAAQIATIVATDSSVKEGDAIAKLVGFKPSGDKVASLEKEIAIFEGQTGDAEKARDAATTDAARKPFETKLLGLAKIIADREAKLVALRRASFDVSEKSTPTAMRANDLEQPRETTSTFDGALRAHPIANEPIECSMPDAPVRPTTSRSAWCSETYSTTRSTGMPSCTSMCAASTCSSSVSRLSSRRVPSITSACTCSCDLPVARQRSSMVDESTP